MVKLDVAAT